MVENNNQQNNDSANQQNDENQNNQVSGSNQIILGCDHNNGEDKAYQDGVEEVLTNAGYIVEKTPIGPNAFASYSYSDQAKGKQGVFLIAAGLTAIVDAWYGNISFDYCVFGIRQHLNGIDSQEDMSKKPISADWHGDCLPVEECKKLVGHTYDEINEITKDKCVAVTGSSPEEMGQNILAALGGQTSSAGGSVSTGSSSQIKDKTFEHCIRRICAATDSVFLVENNAAVLFPYVDWMAFTLRHKIPQIKSQDMDPDLFEINYNTEGFYNKVTVIWGANEEQEKTTKDQEEEEDKKTTGNVTTVQKTMPTGGTQLSEQYDPLVEIYGELEKKVTTNFPNEETAHFVMNALLIQYIRDFNNSCRCRVINNQQLVGGTFYAVENPFSNEIEMFYLNSYTMFKEKKQPLVTDIEFKYGPEGAEELLDYQSLGGVGGSTSSSSSGVSGDEKKIWEEAAKIKYGRGHSTQDPEEAWKMFGGKEDQSSTDCYGMSAYLYYRFNNQANIPCRVVGNSQHHVVMIYKNNAWQETRNEYRSYGFDYLFKWRDNQDTTTILEAKNPPAGSSTNANPSGNTANQNT